MPEKAANDGPSTATHKGHTDGIPVSWLQTGPALVIMAILGNAQHMQDAVTLPC